MEVVKIFGLQSHTIQKIPFFSMSVAAGIPVTADSTVDSEIDLNEFLITHRLLHFSLMSVETT